MRSMLSLVVLCLLSVAATASNDWLLDVDSDQARFERLQGYLGGFSSAMWETGYRYERVREAVEDESYDLARYHWGKIRSAIRNGYMKRPGRQENAEALFLDTAWPELDKALAEGNGERLNNTLSNARGACMACHEAEGVGFMNDMRMFD